MSVTLCQMCGEDEELRPYGPGGMSVCFGCAMKDEATATAQFTAALDSAGPLAVLTDEGPVNAVGLLTTEGEA